MNNSSEKTPDPLEQTVREALQNLKRLEKLQDSPLLTDPLVQQYLQTNPQFTNYEALRKVFDDILEELRQNNKLYADLLFGRYWKGYQVKKMVADEQPTLWSESTFYHHQQRALQQFTLIFRAKEELARPQPVIPIPEASTTSLSASSPLRNLLSQHTYWISILLFILVSLPAAWFLLGYRLQRNSTTGTTLPSIVLSKSECGELTRIDTPSSTEPRFLASQGVSLFTVENTPGGILNNFIRAVEVGPTGLWIGYHARQEKIAKRGLSHFNKQTWAVCNENGGPFNKNINDLAIDQDGHIWVAAEQAGGVQMFDGEKWHIFTTEDGLPSNDTFSITVDQENNIWVGTYQGVAKYNGRRWTTPYTQENGSLFSNHIHNLVFDSEGGIWVGHHTSGISYLAVNSSQWVHLTSEDGLVGDNVRSILVHPADEAEAETIWVATDGGGISELRNQEWITHTEQSGLPSNGVHALELDKHRRVWAATSRGVAYWDGTTWILYHSIPAISIAFGPEGCVDCPYDDDHVFTGTFEHGLTHSRVPYLVSAIDVEKVCVTVNEQNHNTCMPLQAINDNRYQAIYPEKLVPADYMRLEITVKVRAPNQLREDRGDLLANLEDDETTRYGAYRLMPVKGAIDAGQSFTFTSYDDRLVIPTLFTNEPITITSSWRIWMHTRYTGPTIDLLFPIQSIDSTSNSSQ